MVLKIVKTTLILILFASTANCQNSPYFNSSSQWYWSGGWFAFGISSGTYDQLEYIDGDTLINSELYYKVYIDYWDSTWTNTQDSVGTWSMQLTSVDTSEHVFRRHLREESGIVYTYSTSKVLMYNYNLNLGDSVNVCSATVPVTDVTAIPFSISNRYVFELDSAYKGVIVEGVGSHWGLSVGCPTSIGIEGGNYLECYAMDNTTISPLGNTGCTIPTYFKNAIPIGINEVVADDVKVFPNPTSGSIRVLNSSQYEQAMVYNVIGKLIFSKDLNRHSEQIELDMSDLMSGIYIVILQNSYQTKSFKVIKQGHN